MVGTLAAVPASAMHVFNFIATMWNGRIRVCNSNDVGSWRNCPLLLVQVQVVLLIAAMPLDFSTHDSYWVVGHFHLFVMGTIAFGSIGFLYYMFPYVTGRMYNETMGKVHFVMSFM